VPEWGLAVAVVAACTGLAVFGQRVVSQLLGRIDATAAAQREDLAARFAEAEARRHEASDLWRERMTGLAKDLDRVTADYARLDTRLREFDVVCARQHAADAKTYLSVDEYAAREGRVMIQYEKIMERLAALQPPQDLTHG